MAGHGLARLDLADRYSTSTDQMLADFYSPTLTASTAYDRAVGYFSSSLLALVPLIMSDFIEQGGRIRLLCSPHLNAEDASALAELPPENQADALAVAASSLRALASGTALQSASARCLSSLIASGALEMKFAVPQHGAGLFHDKVGIFRDDARNSVVFTGSANETAAAWSGFANHEQILVFRSWLDNDSARCRVMINDFEELWEGFRRGLVVTPAKEAAAIIRAVVEPEPLEQILRSMRGLLGAKEPRGLPLRAYQATALENWESNNHRGIIAFATGGGKTMTAIEGIRRWTEVGRPAIVLVPTQILHDQWSDELSKYLPEVPLLKVGAKSAKQSWLARLADYTRDEIALGARIVLSTYASAATEDFRARVQSHSGLLVVGDEVHVLGAPNTSVVMGDIDAGARLGLSATPERFGDPDGTALTAAYFDRVLDPVFGIAEALQAGVLVPYEYSVRQCTLSEEEQAQWDDLTERIGKAMARDEGEVSELTKLLLIKRARVSKSAVAKALIARDVLEMGLRDGDRWLIYCADLEHLRSVRDTIEELGLNPVEYHSRDSRGQKPALDYFKLRGGVLLAVKCLDEGVDIPLINKALILASSSNPREHIQRRGRVLRRSPGKYSASLTDVIVLDQLGLPISPNELLRAEEFAAHAMNVGPRLYLQGLRTALALHSDEVPRSYDFESDPDEFADE